MASRTDSARNQLLSSLPPGEQALIARIGEPEFLPRSTIVAEQGIAISHVYFPVDCVIAMVNVTGDRDFMGVALVGHEGMLGSTLVLGVDEAPLRARVQEAGYALRVSRSDFELARIDLPTLERQLHLRLYLLLEQFARAAACVAAHHVEQRLAKWLLMTHDRVPESRFTVTHDVLSQMLAVRRSGVSLAAGILQGHGLIAYTRGHIVVRDRKGLERAACSCYRAARRLDRAFARHHESSLIHQVPAMIAGGEPLMPNGNTFAQHLP